MRWLVHGPQMFSWWDCWEIGCTTLCRASPVSSQPSPQTCSAVTKALPALPEKPVRKLLRSSALHTYSELWASCGGRWGDWWSPLSDRWVRPPETFYYTSRTWDDLRFLCVDFGNGIAMEWAFLASQMMFIHLYTSCFLILTLHYFPTCKSGRIPAIRPGCQGEWTRMARNSSCKTW